jgi:preprotein translocase subunit YajC
MTDLAFLLLQAPTPATSDSHRQWFETISFLVPLIAMAALFYFILIAPQRKKQKETQKMIAAADKGDRITTIGGIMGTITAVADDSVTVKVDESNNTKIRFLKSALASVEPKTIATTK